MVVHNDDKKKATTQAVYTFHCTPNHLHSFILPFASSVHHPPQQDLVSFPHNGGSTGIAW